MPVVHSERVDYHHVTNESNPLIAHISISAAITAQVTTSNEFCETEITYFIRHISNVIPIKSEHLQVLPFTKFVWNVTSEVISINVDLLQQCSFVRPPQLAGGNAPLKATLGQVQNPQGCQISNIGRSLPQLRIPGQCEYLQLSKLVNFIRKRSSEQIIIEAQGCEAGKHSFDHGDGKAPPPMKYFSPESLLVRACIPLSVPSKARYKILKLVVWVLVLPSRIGWFFCPLRLFFQGRIGGTTGTSSNVSTSSSNSSRASKPKVN